MNLKEYQADIRKRFAEQGRPRPSARERYYSFPSIIRDYPDQFPHEEIVIEKEEPPMTEKPILQPIIPTHGPEVIGIDL